MTDRVGEEPEEQLFCSVCSEEIEGEPLASIIVAWPKGVDTPTICSADCLELMAESWVEAARTPGQLA